MDILARLPTGNTLFGPVLIAGCLAAELEVMLQRHFARVALVIGDEVLEWGWVAFGIEYVAFVRHDHKDQAANDGLLHHLADRLHYSLYMLDHVARDKERRRLILDRVKCVHRFEQGDINELVFLGLANERAIGCLIERELVDIGNRAVSGHDRRSVSRTDFVSAAGEFCAERRSNERKVGGRPSHLRRRKQVIGRNRWTEGQGVGDIALDQDRTVGCQTSNITHRKKGPLVPKGIQEDFTAPGHIDIALFDRSHAGVLFRFDPLQHSSHPSNVAAQYGTSASVGWTDATVDTPTRRAGSVQYLCMAAHRRWASSIVLLMAVTSIWSRCNARFRYRFDGFPSARVPSLRLHLAEKLGRARFYSQLGQDKWVLGVRFRGVVDGYFVEIGAADASDGSNSLALEQAGWSGICCDPFPTGDWSRRRANLFEGIVYSRGGETVGFRVAGTRGGVDSHIDETNAVVVDAPLVQGNTSTLVDILRRFDAPKFIHYLSLDTEGSEYEILRTFPFGEYCFGAITVEHNGETEKRCRIRELLELNGYRFDREHVVEDWYVSAAGRSGLSSFLCE